MNLKITLNTKQLVIGKARIQLILMQYLIRGEGLIIVVKNIFLKFTDIICNIAARYQRLLY